MARKIFIFRQIVSDKKITDKIPVNKIKSYLILVIIRKN